MRLSVKRIVTVLSAGLMLVLGFGLAGCTSQQPAPAPSVPGRWRDFIDESLANPNLSDFQRQILADYRVTDAEYKDAQGKFSQCMADAGWSVSFPQGGGYSVSASLGSGNDAKDPGDDVNRCSSTSLDVVEEVYLGMNDNPQGLSPEQQIRLCYQKAGVPDGEGLSDDEFAQLVDDPDYYASTPEGVLCYWDPTGSFGWTVGEAQAFDADRRTQETIHISASAPPQSPR